MNTKCSWKLIAASLFCSVSPFIAIITLFQPLISVILLISGILLAVYVLHITIPIMKKDEKEDKETPSVQLCCIMAGSSLVITILLLILFSIMIFLGGSA